MFLEPWLDRRFDLVNVLHCLFDLCPCLRVEQRAACTGPGRIASAGDFIERCIGVDG